MLVVIDNAIILIFLVKYLEVEYIWLGKFDLPGRMLMNKPQLKHIAEIAYKTMYGQRPELCNIQESFYGWVVFVASSRGKAVVKFSREIGRLAKEIEGLSRLQKVLSCPVPDVLFFGREQGYEYLMLEWLDGVPAYNLPKDPQATEYFREHYTDLLIELHQQGSERGFEIAEDRFESCLIKAFEYWMEPVLRYVVSDCSPFSSELKAFYSDLWHQKAEVLAPINDCSSLIHDDCHIGNVLFDPSTFKVAAILDPCDVGYKHREFDLFHLQDVRPDMKLLDRYQDKFPLAEGFEFRRGFLSLWDDAKHSRNIGWYDEQWLQAKIKQYNAICY